MAFDSLTNSIARVLGRLTGGAVLETLGLDDAYFRFAWPYISWRALSSAALTSAGRRESCGLPASRSTLPRASR